MGFECGFEKILKYKDTTLEEYLNISRYLYWKKYKDQFLDETGNPYTYKEYWESRVLADEEREFPGEPDPDKVEFYDTHRFEIEYDWQTEGYTSKTIDYWCSIGRYLDEEFIYDEVRHLEPYKYCEDYGPLDMNFVNKGLDWVKEELEKNQMIPVNIVKGYQYVDEDYNTQTVTIDGIEVEDEDGNIRKLDCEYDNVFVSKNRYFDPERFNALERFRDCLFEIKKILEEDKYIVYYFRSY